MLRASAPPRSSPLLPKANTMNQPTTFKHLQIIYFALLLGQVFMGLVIFFLMKDQAAGTVEVPFNFIIPGAVIFGIIGSQFLQRKQNGSIPTSGTPDEKFAHFRKWGIMKWAIAEGGNLLSLVLTFIMGNMTTYTWFGVGLVMFAFLRPTLDKFATDYQLSPNELNG